MQMSMPVECAKFISNFGYFFLLKFINEVLLYLSYSATPLLNQNKKSKRYIELSFESVLDRDADLSDKFLRSAAVQIAHANYFSGNVLLFQTPSLRQSR